ncbi:MAG: hypothetical protein NVSMB6_09800 [Burkholderiaceae bacterium]
MQIYYLVAATLIFVVGLVHSLLGEFLIFNQMRDRHLVPTVGHPVLKERHVRILWATWHGVTFLGWAMGAILLMYALPHTSIDSKAFVLQAIAFSMAGVSALVLIATNGTHPAWFGLLAVAALIWFG